MTKNAVFALSAVLLSVGAAGVLSLKRAPDGKVPVKVPVPTLRAPSAAALTPPPKDEIGATCETIGLMVQTAIGPKENGFEPLPFMGFTRTRLAVRLVLPSKGIFDLNADRSKVDVFRDDRGTDMLARSTDSFQSSPIEMSPTLAEDGGSVVFIVGSDKIPAGNASQLEMKGTVALHVATRKVEFRADDVQFQPGQVVELGPYHLEIVSSGPSDWDPRWSLEVRSSVDLAPIIAWQVVAPDGEVVDMSPTMSMSGMGTWQQTVAGEKTLDHGSLVITAWADARTLEVPFALTTGVGLGDS